MLNDNSLNNEMTSDSFVLIQQKTNSNYLQNNIDNDFSIFTPKKKTDVITLKKRFSLEIIFESKIKMIHHVKNQLFLMIMENNSIMIDFEENSLIEIDIKFPSILKIFYVSGGRYIILANEISNENIKKKQIFEYKLLSNELNVFPFTHNSDIIDIVVRDNLLFVLLSKLNISFKYQIINLY